MNELLEKTLKNPYNKENFLHLLNHIFKDFDKHEVDISDLILNSSEKEKVQSFSLLGKAKVDSKYIYVLDVELKRNVESSPIFQRNIISKFLKRDFSDIAFVAYHTQGERKWKIALVRVAYKEDKEISETRRFYYVVGNEEVHTPMEVLGRLFDRNITLEDILEAFSIEKVTKEFFQEISSLFYDLVGGSIKRNNRTEEHRKLLILPPSSNLKLDPSKVERMFAIRLLSRLIFVWFLKKKGLISDEILSSKAVFNYKEKVPLELKEYKSYYHSVLEPLFFEVLNKKHSEREVILLKSEFFKDIPFLNGGIFNPNKEEDFYDKDKKELGSRCDLDLKIPDIWFKKLFELFERYNFTVDESTPIDIDISIDPEMLGRIFENLLAEIDEETQETSRKATGSYYTPREIVEYMVTESLKYYLKSKTTLTEDEIESLLSYQEEEIPLDVNKKKEVVDALDSIKIIDPACGSGAFPMGILQKLILILKKVDPDNKFWIEKKLGKIDDPALREVEKKKWLKEKEETNYLRKLGLLRDSIYGVDIQPYATEISRLRAFLTLIVDKHVDKNKENFGIEPLPNLDFKFVTANSLIDVEKIDTNNPEESTFFYDTFYDELEKLTDEYFYLYDREQKEKVRMMIENLINTKIKDKEKEILSMVNSLSSNFNKKLSSKQEFLKEKYEYEIDLWESYKNIFTDNPVKFFNVKYFFPSVKDGFDIVIANPPYIVYHLDSQLKTKYIENSVSFDNKGKKQFNLACLFLEKSLNLLKGGGVASLIVPHSISRVEGYHYIRYFLNKNSDIFHIVDESSKFENVTLEMISIFYAKTNIKAPFVSVFSRRDGKNYAFPKKLIDEDKHFPLYYNKIHEKIRKKGTNGILEGFRGISNIRTYSDKLDKSFIIFLEGRNLKKYRIELLKNQRYINPKDLNSNIINSLNAYEVVITQFGALPKGTIIDTRKYIPSDGIVIVRFDRNIYDPYFILGIINSTVTSYYFHTYILNKADLTIHLDSSYLNKIVIPKLNVTIQREISKYVKEYLFDPQSTNNKEKSRELIRKIDNILFNFFEFDEDELSEIIKYENYGI